MPYVRTINKDYQLAPGMRTLSVDCSKNDVTIDLGAPWPNRRVDIIRVDGSAHMLYVKATDTKINGAVDQLQVTVPYASLSMLSTMTQWVTLRPLQDLDSLKDTLSSLSQQVNGAAASASTATSIANAASAAAASAAALANQALADDVLEDQQIAALQTNVAAAQSAIAALQAALAAKDKTLVAQGDYVIPAIALLATKTVDVVFDVPMSDTNYKYFPWIDGAQVGKVSISAPVKAKTKLTVTLSALVAVGTGSTLHVVAVESV